MRLHYRVHVERPTDHLAQFTLEVRELDAASFDVVLPSWVPGSYEIQPTSRGVVSVGATATGETTPLPVALVDKARWRVTTGGSRSVEFHYTMYGHIVATDGLDVTPDHLFLSPPICFPYVDGRKEEPCEVTVFLPDGWKAFTELKELASHPPRFRAENYDELVDSPIDCGTPVVFPIVAMGVPHRIVLCGEGGNYEPHRLQQDLTKIAETTIRLFGESPVPRYTFFYHLSDTYDGALEHATSNMGMFRRDAFRPEVSYEKFLWVSSHEYFHLYNVKRLRPKVLGPFDYTREVYTRLLWWMEGTTDYYGLLVLRRAGILTPSRYREKIAEQLVELRGTPGRALQSLEDASVRSWVDYYKRYENSPNQSVSYYLKGHLVSLCLDLEIRHRTEGRHSLDSVLRELWVRFGRAGRGLGEEELLPTMNEVTGLDLTEFFSHYISGTRELDIERFLGYAGLSVRAKERPTEPDPDGEAGYLGSTLRNVDNRPVVSSVLSGGPASQAGLSPGDEVVSLERAKVTFDGFTKSLKGLGPGSEVELGIFRRGWWRVVRVTLGQAPPDKLLIEPRPAATEVERSTYESWLSATWETPKAK
ncbi:MAG: PDZ domain-containing protein [Thermoplasmata archaeon]|nr:PDZ domain-containing protein [Thermoplasmata archaeon]